MDYEEFWSIIQSCHESSNGEMNLKDRLIKSKVSQMSRREAEAFWTIFNQLMDSAYTWDLWGAAYVINSGCGDDAFSDFRASLISRGRAVYEQAIADADSLAEENIDLDAWFHEGFQYAIIEGVSASLGTRPQRSSAPPLLPVGTQWTEATVRNNFPKLASKLALR